MADLAHLWPPFRAQVEALLKDPAAVALGVHVVSAYRSPELQAALFADKVIQVKRAHPNWTPAQVDHEARKWVAPPGHSNHGPKVDDQGHEPGNWGRAVDFGVPGVPAVSGRWPTATKRAMDTLGSRYRMHSPMAWEDWHYEPDPDLHANPEPDPEEDEMAPMFVIDPKGPDDIGRDSVWEFDRDGNAKNWNGARPLKSRHELDPGATVPVVAVVPDPTGDGVVLIGGDQRQDERGHWVCSTWRIVADG